MSFDPTTLHAKYAGMDRWVLTEALAYRSQYGMILVPEGYVTDLDSVPRIPGVFALAKGRTVLAAVVHDWLYDRPEAGGARLSRRQADRVMLAAMADEGVPRRHRWAIYAGVRIGGWWSWFKHRRGQV